MSLGISKGMACEHYKGFTNRLKRSMRQIHRVGEKLFVDFLRPQRYRPTTGRRAHGHLAVTPLRNMEPVASVWLLQQTPY